MLIHESLQVTNVEQLEHVGLLERFGHTTRIDRAEVEERSRDGGDRNGPMLGPSFRARALRRRD